jgi:NhaP-type Na+/H+ or K+/H+ antiporter
LILVQRLAGELDLVRLLGDSVGFADVDVRVRGLLVATAGGAILGAALGFLTRRLIRLLPRMLFFSMFMPALWLCVHSLVLTRVSPTLAAALPAAAPLIGALGYGLCVAIVRPVTRSRAHR